MDVTSKGWTAAAPEQVWAVLSDIEAWPRWAPTMTSVAPAEGSPGADAGPDVGSTFDVVQPRLGRARWQVTEWQTGRAFTWVSRRPGVRSTATHRLRPEGDGTAVELGVAWSGPAAWVARLFFGQLTQRFTDLELAALVAAAEARSAG